MHWIGHAIQAMMQTAEWLKASRLATGMSPKIGSDELARRIELA